jgi:hypothetical protein
MCIYAIAVLDAPEAFGPGLITLQEAFGTVDQD